MRLLEITALLAIAAAALPGVTAVPDTCNQVRQRPEIRNMSSAQRASFIAAVRRLQSGQQPTTFDKFSKWHYDARNVAHGYSWFFSWHRAFLRAFEKELQAVDSSVMIPYWNWAYDSQVSELSPVFGPDYFGGNGQNGQGCITTGPFASYRPFYPNPKCLTRSWDGGDKITSLSPQSVIDSIAQTASYAEFRLNIEGIPHNQVHVAIGGDMVTMNSPNDPLFYLHHAMVDKIWADWQAKPGNARKYDGRNQNGSPARETDVLTPFNYIVRDVLDTRSLCYTYAPFVPPTGGSPRLAARAVPTADNATTTGNATTASGAGFVVKPATNLTGTPAAPSASDRTELVALRVSNPIPEAWLRMNNQDVPAVRQGESKARDVINKLNAQPNFISPSSPLMQPQVLAKLAANNRELTATNADRKVVVQIQPNAINAATIKAVVAQVDSKIGTSASRASA